MTKSTSIPIAYVGSPPAQHKSEVIASLPENLRTGLQLSQLPALDGFRAVAAFLVVFYHLGYDNIPGGLGVLIFFVLSGFLITWLLLKENEATRSISLRYFYIRRSLRIFPAFYSYWLLFVGLSLILHKGIIWNQAVAALFYVNNYFQATHQVPATGLSDTWSLAVEEQFYLLWAPLFFLLRKRPNRQVWVLLGLIGLIWVHRELLQFVFGVWEGYIYMAFDTRADHLLMGCLLAVLLRSGYLGGVWHAICSRPALSVITSILLIASVELENHFGTSYRDAVGFVVDPVLVGLLIVQAIAFRKTILWRWLELAWMRYLGRISYSIYLYQGLVRYSVLKRVAGLPTIVQLASVVAVVVLLATTSYFVIERPLLRLKDRFRETPRVSAEPAINPKRLTTESGSRGGSGTTRQGA